MTKEYKNFLTADAIKIFISANILHAIDHDLLKCTFADVKIDVDTVTPNEESKYIIHLSLKDKKLLTFFVSMYTENKEDQYRSLMGGTMAMLEALLEETKNSKPVLRVVK